MAVASQRSRAGAVLASTQQGRCGAQVDAGRAQPAGGARLSCANFLLN
jgi:hypothetical protein